MDQTAIPATERGALYRPGFLSRPFVAAVIFSSLTILVLAPLALARISRNTIDPLAALSDRGRLVIATGPIACIRGQRVFLSVTITQRTTGAIAEGTGRIVCTGDDQQWEIHAATEGKTSFDEGPAIAVAVARSADRGKITDAHQWLVEITLVEE